MDQDGEVNDQTNTAALDNKIKSGLARQGVNDLMIPPGCTKEQIVQWLNSLEPGTILGYCKRQTGD